MRMFFGNGRRRTSNTPTALHDSVAEVGGSDNAALLKPANVRRSTGEGAD